jgi:hypothetical protein
MQITCGVFDITAVSRLQFLGDPNRLNLGFGGARAGLYIVGDWIQLERPSTKCPGVLRKIALIAHVLRHLSQRQARSPVPESWQTVIREVRDGQLMTSMSILVTP